MHLLPFLLVHIILRALIGLDIENLTFLIANKNSKAVVLILKEERWNIKF